MSIGLEWVLIAIFNTKAVIVTPTKAKGFVETKLDDLKGGLATEIVEMISLV